MQVLALILVAVTLADCKGSGPYLPSGWRPEGPAFFLPSEVIKPLLTPEIDVNLQGSEASGSDFLREYGPPKVQEVSQNLLNQGLPDISVEQTFGGAAPTASQVAAEHVGESFEVKPEAVSIELPTTASLATVDENPPISAELPILDFIVKEITTIPNIEQATESIIETNQQISQESASVQSNQQNFVETISVQSNKENSQASLQYVTGQIHQLSSPSQSTEVPNVQSNQQNSDLQTLEVTLNSQPSSQESATTQTNSQESTQSLKSQQESSTASGVEKATATGSFGKTGTLLENIPSIFDQNVPELQNIPDIIAGLEKEIFTEQAEVKQAVSEIASAQSLSQVPEGFLEYGPPGFAEYGPPKEDQEKSQNLRAIDETNETRRRRFSPRIRWRQ